ncbi:hypothetical protein E2P63_07330 [Candidatus Bathyarchaeota archaeon]|nr:hypothetical protein E2P63_07330 [Candidatus Bathyarchaeota archaeon]
MNRLEYTIFRILRLFRKIPLNRILNAGASTHPFISCFKDFDKVNAVRGIFGDKTTEVLSNLKVDFTLFSGYMYVDSSNGHLVVSSRYLKTGDKIDIYLDLIHELCHVKQFQEGKDLFDQSYTYVERPTEIEAYRYTVTEARRLGLSDKRICKYLKTEWMSDRDFKFLAKTVGVRCQ